MMLFSMVAIPVSILMVADAGAPQTPEAEASTSVSKATRPSGRIRTQVANSAPVSSTGKRSQVQFDDDDQDEEMLLPYQSLL